MEGDNNVQLQGLYFRFVYVHVLTLSSGAYIVRI